MFSWFRKKKKQEKIKSQEIVNNNFGHLSDGSKYYKGIARSGYSPTFNVRLKRQNSRTTYESSPEARSVIRRLTDTVVDSGLVFKSSPIASLLGISEEQARQWGDVLSTKVHMFMNSKSFTSNEMCNGYQFTRLSCLTQLRDGEYFVKFNRRKKGKNSISELSLQSIDPNRVNSYGIVSTDGNNDIADNGIKRNEYGKEISYNVSLKQKDGTILNIEIPADSSSGSKQMVHGFIQEYPDQYRGLSIISHQLQEFANLLDFNLSHIMKAVAQSQWVFATESDTEEASFDPTEGIGAGFGAPPIDFNGLEVEPSVAEINEADTLIYRSINEGQLRQPGSNLIVNAPPGNKVKMLENTAPVTTYNEFVNSYMSNLAASADIPLEVVLMKFNQNYSASRATLVLAWRVAGIYQAELVSDLLSEIVRAFVELEIANGRITAPGFSDPIMREAWLNGKWVGKPMPEIDPYKTMRSIELKAGMGLTDLDREALETNGSDGSVNRQKLKQQYKELPEAPWKKALTKQGGNL
jgi:capsid protein